MPAATQDRDTKRREGTQESYPVKAATRIWAGTLACVDATGFVVPGSVSTTQKCVGVATKQVNNLSGANGDQSLTTDRRPHWFNNSTAGDLIALSDVGAQCFIVDDNTVAKTNGTNTRSVAGKIVNVSATQGVLVDFR
jgi:hypothetical protein